MLSNIDIKKILGKHIGIYPFNPNHIEGASIDLTASCYAWSIKEKKTAIDEKDNSIILIKPNDTTVIFTNEFITLDQNYAGACYNRILFSINGIHHSSSPLKPGYTGRLSVSFNNNSSETFNIRVDDPIVVIMLHRLHKQANTTFGNGGGSRFDMLCSLGIEIDNETRNNLSYYDDRNRLLDEMKSDQEFKQYKKTIFSKKTFFKVFIPILILFCISIYYAYNYGLEQFISLLIVGIITALLARFL